jgi:hypothetical protein
MDNLNVDTIKNKFINTKKQFNYLLGLLLDNDLKTYTENYQIEKIFQLDSSLDMLNINIQTIINEIEMYENCGIGSNNIIDTDNDDHNSIKNILNTVIDNFNTSNNIMDSELNSENDGDDENEECDNDENDGDGDNDCDDENKEDDNIDTQLINFFSTFTSSFENPKQIPKALLPYIFYTYMKLDPESILNKTPEQNETNQYLYPDGIPFTNDNTSDFLSRQQTNSNLINDIGRNNIEVHENNIELNDKQKYEKFLIGPGVEDLD